MFSWVFGRGSGSLSSYVHRSGIRIREGELFFLECACTKFLTERNFLGKITQDRVAIGTQGTTDYLVRFYKYKKNQML